MKEATARRYDREVGHGRRETRSVRTLTVTSLGLDFPHRGSGECGAGSGIGDHVGPGPMVCEA